MIPEPQEDIFDILTRAARWSTVVILIACGIIIFAGCSPFKYCPRSIPIKDSLVKETTHTIVFKKMEQLGQLNDSTVTAKKAISEHSHLETDAAISDAWVDNTGKLNHSLKNKTDALTRVFVNIPHEVTTEKIYLTKNLIQYKEKELSRWEKFLISLGRITFTMLIISIIYLTIKLLKKVKSCGLF